MPADLPPDNHGLGQISEKTVYEQMDPFVPYTTRELADRVDSSLGDMWAILRGLAMAGRIQKKEPEPNLRIWMREPPENTCSQCDYQFEVKFVYPVASSVRYCPHCGNQVSNMY